MKLVKDGLCEKCLDKFPRGILFQGLGDYTKINICKRCIIKAYEMIRDDEKHEMVSEMRQR